MSILTDVANVFGGDIFGSLIQTVKDYFPPTMTEADKAKTEIALLTAKGELDAKLTASLNEVQSMYEQRMRDMEGTATDLKAVPLIGPLVIFFRGMQRPLWGFGVLFMDYMVFSGDWKILDNTRQDTCFLVINLLVLTFLFGERAMKNISPLIERLLSAKA